MNKHPHVVLIDSFIDGPTQEVKTDSLVDGSYAINYLEVREGGNLEDKAIHLNSTYNWSIVFDDEDEVCLIATKY